jgi:hypothetical protein
MKWATLQQSHVGRHKGLCIWYLQRLEAEFFNVQILVELYDTSKIIPFHTSFQGLLTLLAPTTVETKLVCFLAMNNSLQTIIVNLFLRTCASYCIKLASCHFFFSHFWTIQRIPSFCELAVVIYKIHDICSWHVFSNTQRASQASLRAFFFNNHLTFI